MLSDTIANVLAYYRNTLDVQQLSESHAMKDRMRWLNGALDVVNDRRVCEGINLLRWPRLQILVKIFATKDEKEECYLKDENCELFFLLSTLKVCSFTSIYIA